MRFWFSIYFSVAIFINSFICTVMLSLGVLIRRKYLDKKIYANKIASIWARNSFLLTFSSVKIVGMENVDYSKNYIVVSNHASNSDIFLLLGYLKLRSVFISKSANFRIPIVGISMRLMGCIPINRSNPRAALLSMIKASDAYDSGDSIIIFPEGTRSPDGNPMDFKSGFLHLISKSSKWILPISLSGTHHLQSKRSWLVYPSRVKLVIHKPILINPEQVSTPERRKQVLGELHEIVVSGFERDYR